ncbi:unnamed protein product [Rhizophagus irregularis]|nr:unnamed protein product [Rhizophagus irregularis]CAB5143978.1 unnamed protein product [Rhizophagus irregularis]
MFKNFCIPSLDDSINAVSSMYAVTATFFRYFTQLLGSEGLVGQLQLISYPSSLLSFGGGTAIRCKVVN